MEAAEILENQRDELTNAYLDGEPYEPAKQDIADKQFEMLAEKNGIFADALIGDFKLQDLVISELTKVNHDYCAIGEAVIKMLFTNTKDQAVKELTQENE